MPAYRLTRFVDATGAGDAASAGFLAQYLRDPADVQAALRWAAAAGAVAVSKPGACERPMRKEEVEATLEAGVVMCP